MPTGCPLAKAAAIIAASRSSRMNRSLVMRSLSAQPGLVRVPLLSESRARLGTREGVGEAAANDLAPPLRRPRTLGGEVHATCRLRLPPHRGPVSVSASSSVTGSLTYPSSSGSAARFTRLLPVLVDSSLDLFA